MLISNLFEIDDLLKQCRAIAVGDPTEGGDFYIIKRQLFRYPDGTRQSRDYIDKKRASVIVPVTDEGNFVFVIQPVGLAGGGALIEFPAGYWEFGENGVEAGRRELAEETGYTTDNPLIYLDEHYQDPGSIRRAVDVYLATDCRRTQEQKLDRGEYVKYVEVPPDLVNQMIGYHYFQDANTIVALFKALWHLENR